jgi:glucokinase
MISGPSGLAIGVDVGGTKLAAGLVHGGGEVVYRCRRETPNEPEALCAEIVDLVAEIEHRHAVGHVPVGIGIAAIVDHNGVARYAPNLPLVDRPILDELRKSLDRTAVTVDNDANVAAWGEYRVGAGTDAVSSLLMLTVGTGVGGGLVLDGRLVRGAWGFAGEFGHIIVDEGGPQCACGNFGCLEALASGTAIGRMAREALAAGAIPPDSVLYTPGGIPRVFSGTGAPIGGPDKALVPDSLTVVREITGKVVTVAAQAGDRFAIELLARCGFWLGVGLASLVNALDPEIVVVGGGVIQAGELLLEPARMAMVDRLVGVGHRPVPGVVSAQLGDDAGLVGAALLALDHVRAALDDPAFQEKP